ncbi:MAG: ABC transporter permease [Phycisphaerales bacterium]|nr:ABC transporter permease [Phycisphaerales bacterium]
MSVQSPTLGRCGRVYIVFRREFRSYFATPLAAVFLVIFLFLAGLFTFNIGSLYERGQADLRPFFQFVPWLFLLILPAISMRLWAEERRTGTIELLVTLPFALSDLVLGKFFAAWAFAVVAILLTIPFWFTLAWLGDPDHGALCTGYLATILLAGFMLSIGALISAWTKNQVIAFVLSVAVSFIILLLGYPAALDVVRAFAPSGVIESLASTSALTHFDALMRGVVDLRDVLYFVLGMAVFLWLNTAVIDWKKSD